MDGQITQTHTYCSSAHTCTHRYSLTYSVTNKDTHVPPGVPDIENTGTLKGGGLALLLGLPSPEPNDGEDKPWLSSTMQLDFFFKLDSAGN